MFHKLLILISGCLFASVLQAVEREPTLEYKPQKLNLARGEFECKILDAQLKPARAVMVFGSGRFTVCCCGRGRSSALGERRGATMREA